MGETSAEDSIADARGEVIEAFKQSAEFYGLSQSYGHLYGVLYFADEPLSLDDLVEQTGYAKSTVSNAMKAMQRLHLVHRRSIPGEGKKAFFEAERDFWRVAQEFLNRQVQREIDTMSRALESAESTLEGTDGEQAQRDLERIRNLKSMYDRSQTLVNVLTNSSLSRLSQLVKKIQ